MRPISILTTVVIVAGTAGLAIWVAVEHQARLTLSQEHQVLQNRLDQMARLLARNDQQPNLVAGTPAPQPLPEDQFRELLRLRGELGVLRQQAREIQSVRDENRQPRAANAVATEDYWPRDSWTFSGYSSPDKALQSSFWAANNGDLKTLAASATGDVQKLMEAQYGGKSDTEASIRAMDDVSGLKSVRILNREVQGDDTVVLTVSFESRTDTQTGKLVMKKIGNDWKISALSQ
jgi:hypothetical protein